MFHRITKKLYNTIKLRILKYSCCSVNQIAILSCIMLIPSTHTMLCVIPKDNVFNCFLLFRRNLIFWTCAFFWSWYFYKYKFCYTRLLHHVLLFNVDCPVNSLWARIQQTELWFSHYLRSPLSFTVYPTLPIS